MRTLRLCLTATLAAILIGVAGVARAHEGHAEAPGQKEVGPTEGPVFVSEAARRNLGLRTEEAELRPLERTLRAVGEIQAEPYRSGTVSSRIAGRVLAVHAKEGEHVRRGQRLVELESFQVGDPPPRVTYRAPIAGTVIDRHVVAGDDVEPNRHLFEIADLREVLAVGQIFEGQIGRVAVGQKVRVRVPGYPGRVFEGVIDRLGGQLDPVSRSLPVFVRVENPDEALRPHMRAMLSLVTKRAGLALAVPKDAVLGEFGNPFVFVQREDEPDFFERRAVVTGLSDDRYIEIREGVLPGELVVVEGSYSLQYLPPVSEPSATAEPLEHAEIPEDRSAHRWRWGLALAIGILLTTAFLRAVRKHVRMLGKAH